MISYTPLWKTLLDHGMKKQDLQAMIGCSSATIATMSKNKHVSMDIIERICGKLGCRVEDVIEYVQDARE